MTPGTPVDEIHAAYRSQRQQTAALPTLHSEQAALRRSELAALDWAWRILSDEASRRDHDRALEARGSSTPELGDYGAAAPVYAPRPPTASPGWGAEWTPGHPPRVEQPRVIYARPLLKMWHVIVLLIVVIAGLSWLVMSYPGGVALSALEVGLVVGMILGGLGTFFGYVWLIVSAFKQSVLWGLVLLFTPFAVLLRPSLSLWLWLVLLHFLLMLAYAMTHWSTARRPFLVYLVSLLLYGACLASFLFTQQPA